jgi:23S rRNA pseudouridine1911/1915/1917 synthase
MSNDRPRQPRQSWRFTVEPCEAGLRLDVVIPARTSLSRRSVREALKIGGVQVNRRRVRVAGRTPPPGAEIRIAIDESLGEAPDFAPDVIFEDDWLLALYKPAGIPAQGTEASDRHDFMAVARRHFPEQELYLVHRLDAGTSGVMLLAKTPKAAGEMGKLFREQGVKKTYLAATEAQVGALTLEMPIGRVPGASPVRYGCAGDLVGPKPAATVFGPPDQAAAAACAGIGPPDAFWTAAEPLTGRTHQVRVHLAHLGSPVLGDTFYGGPRSDRLWLHAWRLELGHPMSGEALVVQADFSRGASPAPI